LPLKGTRIKGKSKMARKKKSLKCKDKKSDAIEKAITVA
jgi:hypothetical protein